VSYYHDDPTEESRSRKSIIPSFLVLILLISGGGFFVKTTLAANVALNSGASTEFGQSVSQAVACSGGQNLTVTPKSSFVNAANGTGTYYLRAIEVKNIPTSCNGVNFNLRAYNSSSSTPLAIFNTTSTEAIVNYDALNVSLRAPFTGISISGGNGAFTVNFTSPVAQSTTVAKVTIQSGLGTDRTYQVGERGPGGGIVFYVSATNFTSAGSNCHPACRYLEVAPATWQSEGATVANDITYQWSSSNTVATGQDTVTAGTESGFAGEKFNWKIGQGFYNTSVMRVSGATSAAQAKVLAYAGGATAGQWFIPSVNELNELCKYARGQTTGVPTVACVGGGTLKSGTANDLGGFVNDRYQSSSEFNTSSGYRLGFQGLAPTNNLKEFSLYVRPIRAF
jgi:hypothetical protein